MKSFGLYKILDAKLDIPDKYDHVVGIAATIGVLVISLGWVAATLFLSVKFSPWFLFLLILTPVGRIRTGKYVDHDNVEE
jgi:multisubunit Na+/H+ antiporter MnhG subunit